MKLGKYHFCIMSERTLCYRTDNVRAKCSKSQKWEGKGRALKRHVCVGWCVKWNSLWCYTTLPSYNFIEWMISMIVTVRLWRHSNIIRIRPDLYMLIQFDISNRCQSPKRTICMFKNIFTLRYDIVDWIKLSNYLLSGNFSTSKIFCPRKEK